MLVIAVVNSAKLILAERVATEFAIPNAVVPVVTVVSVPAASKVMALVTKAAVRQFRGFVP